jgi:hypothetical protein
MMIAALDKTRLVVGAIVAFVVFLFILFWGTLLTTFGLCWTAKRFLGEEHPLVILPISILFLILASVAARRLFKRIIGARKGLGELHEGGCIPEEET